MAIKEMKAKHGTPKEKIASGKTKDGPRLLHQRIPCHKDLLAVGTRGYIQLPQGVAYIVLTSRDKASYQKDSGALEKVLKTLVSVEPKSEGGEWTGIRSPLQTVAGSACGGQIEPLLTEWREKAPDDPDAWITSANYYFTNARRTFRRRNPAQRHYVDDKEGKANGSISFEQNKTDMKRAADSSSGSDHEFPESLGYLVRARVHVSRERRFDNELSTLKKMVAYTREHPAQLKWLKGEPLSEPADKFVPEKLPRVRFVLREKGERGGR